MIDVNIKNETSELVTVVLGIAENFGGIPLVEDCYDPKSIEHVQAGTFPNSKSCVDQINEFFEVLEKYNVNILRPKNIYGINQIFTRDIAFVIENKLILPNIIKDRVEELTAISYILDQVNTCNVIKTPSNVRVEGGDVLVCNDHIFVGYSEKEDFDKYIVSRTNRLAINFLSQNFPAKEVKGFELNKSDVNPRNNALHLDCCFQPIGKDKAIIHKAGFKRAEDIEYLANYFGAENLIEINTEEMYNMNANVFSISEKVIVSDRNFTSLNYKLKQHGFTVEEISYSEIGKMSGLLRCSTMPLVRR
ncbi:MAG: arginine deiminase family protein [Flavobacteriales bacterium]|nr:arginine deiminase family protein [Flavobacteriales bacterium]|tara:strand:+ start:510 stop:1424 length:915 start_codon:yes stop_codon:yes gene_type:complete